MDTWWIVRDYDMSGSWPNVVPGHHLAADVCPDRIAKTMVGPYWTRGEAARIVRLWKGFSG